MPQARDRAAGTGTLRFGAVFPTSDIGDDPIAIRDYAQGLEELGYDHLIAYDHVLGAEHADREPALTGPYDEHTAFHEPFVLFGYLAGLTRTLAADRRGDRAAATPDRTRRQAGRRRSRSSRAGGCGSASAPAGTGSSTTRSVCPSAGGPSGSRSRSELLRRLWAEPLVTTHTGFHDIERAGILPRPAGPIPIWFGGSAERQLRRAARLGDGFICTRADENARGLVAQLRTFLAEAGREANQFDLSGMIDWAHGPDECARATTAWREAGGTHLALRVFDVLSDRLGVPKLGYTTVDRQLEALRTYGDLVGVGSSRCVDTDVGLLSRHDAPSLTASPSPLPDRRLERPAAVPDPRRPLLDDRPVVRVGEDPELVGPHRVDDQPGHLVRAHGRLDAGGRAGAADARPAGPGGRAGSGRSR